MDDIQAWIAFSQLDCLSLSQKHTLYNQSGSVHKALERSTAQINLYSDADQQPLYNRVDQQKLDQTLGWINTGQSKQIVCYSDENYPFLLKQTSNPPLILYTQGDVGLLSTRQIAIVGARKATLAGQQHAQRFAEQLSSCGITVTSGMATGIDSSAHKGALNQSGNTIAVLGTGIDRCYPVSNKLLYRAIADRGLLISEFNLASAPQKAHFPQRNRIISGLSMGTLVVEAAKRSGSLITARFAVQQNREVFAVPGSIASNLAHGCLDLIQQGAKLTRTVEDILDEFSEFSALDFNNTQPEPEDKHRCLSVDHTQIVEQMNDVPLSFDKLFSQSGLTLDQLCSILLDLELGGMIEKLPGNQYLRTTK